MFSNRWFSINQLFKEYSVLQKLNVLEIAVLIV